MNVATIMTERLILKELNLEDATMLVSKIYTKDNTKYLINNYNPSLEDIIGYLGEIVNENKKINAKTVAFGIHSNEVLVGVIALNKSRSEKDSYEIEAIMDPMYQRIGFTYEALIAIIDYCKKNKVKKIIAKMDVRDIACINLMEKIKMKRVNLINQRLYPNKEKSFELTYEYVL